MRLLIITEFFPVSEEKITGGVETRVWHLVKNSKETNKIQIICSKQPGQKNEEFLLVGKNKIKVHRVGPTIPYSNDGHVLGRLKFIISAYKKAKEIKNSWDHVHGMSFLSYNIVGKLGKIKDKKNSITYHECWIGDWRQHKKFPINILGEISERTAIKNKFDKIISVSKFTSEELKKKAGKKSIVIPNGIDLEEYKEYKGKKDGVIIIGRITKDKNVDFALKNLEELKIKTTVIGEGPLKKELQKKYPDIKFLGRVERKKLLDELSKARIYVNASTLEGFGIGVIEAAAANTSYVVSDIPPFSEVTKGGKGGKLFKPLNDFDFKKKIREVKQDSKSLKMLANLYHWKKISKEFYEVLE